MSRLALCLLRSLFTFFDPFFDRTTLPLPQVHFKGSAVQGSLANELLRRAKAPGLYRALGKAVSLQEGQGGGPVTKFAQDTGVGWFPKLLVSRTLVEGVEITFLEFLESAMAYLLPFLGGPVLEKLFHKAAGGKARLDRKLLTRPLDSLSKAEAARAVPVKAAVILTTIAGIGLLGESLVNYGKNLMTAHFFHKDKFSDVVNLSQGHMHGVPQNSPQVQKSRKRIKQVATAFGGILASMLALARFGHRLPQGMQNLLHEGVRRMDFDFSKGRQYSIGRGLLGGIMLTSMFPYLDSARDKYERMETLCRLPIVFLYILFGQELLQKGMVNAMPGLFKGILKQTSSNASRQGMTQVMAMEELVQKALREAALKHGVSLSADTIRLADLPPAVLKTAALNLQAPLQAKALHVAAPLGVGILGTGLGLGLLSRAFTAYRYQQQQAISPAPSASFPVVQASKPAFSSFYPPSGVVERSVQASPRF